VRGGSGSLYILWSGKYKLNTAAAIPYYTGHYAPSDANGGSRVGFGFVAIGASVEDFTEPAQRTQESLNIAAKENLDSTTTQLLATTAAIITLVVFVAIWLAGYITNNITLIIAGISRFRRGERQFRFKSEARDEFGQLAHSFDQMADAVVGSVNSPLSITDMDLNIIYMNDYGLSFNGITLEDVVGHDYQTTTIYPRNSVYDPILALREDREAEVYFHEARNRYYKGSANYLLDSAHIRIGYIIITTDVTELSLKQIELEHAVDAANRANEHKGEFLARMSHEIRTPMNAIIGITSIVRRRLGELSIQSSEITDICDNVAQIETSSQHLLSLLNDILDISKIEAGKIEINEEPMGLVGLFDIVNGIIGPRCADKNIVYDTVFDDFTADMFLSDPLRLRQVLINLLGNAVKFTPELGHVFFSVKRKEQADGKSLVEFVVRDTGIGISEENLSTIFKPFEQGDSLVTRKYGGTGLGLSISRRIVQLLGGDISVRSQLGDGSEFTFAIWLTETEHSDDIISVTPEDATGRFTGKRLLLVDDVEINRMIVATMLEDTGIEVVEADDGTTALDEFKAAPVGSIDIILMDVQMPQLDGYGATRAIRELDRADAGTVPIVALTANAFKDDIDKALASGMNSHIAKPVELDTLIETLFKYLV
jgi:signal transduction histidine kinase/ActR/RegA family two-component response regulator